MQAESLQARIEQALRTVAEIDAAVEVQGNVVRLNGMVDSSEQRVAAEDIVAQVAPGMTIDNELEIESIGLEQDANFTDQATISDAAAAAGPSGSREDDEAEDGDEVYTPPTDPVVTMDAHGAAHVTGGFGMSSTDSVEVERSSDGTLGDEAIEDAVRRELKEDATTTDLPIRVVVQSGVVHLHGQLAGAEDAEHAEEVAARVPGVIEVVDETEIAA